MVADLASTELARHESDAVETFPAASVENVTLSFKDKDRVPALNDVSIHCHKGEVLGIVGPNGAGKSTLLKTMAGILQPDSGCVRLYGDNLSSTSIAARSRRVAYTPQFAAQHSFTVTEVVLMGRYPHLRRFQVENRRDLNIAAVAMKSLDVLQFQSRRFESLSGGERQRALLARALAQKADILLVDEPTASLDIKHQLLVLRTLNREASELGKAACIAMHDLNLAARFCDRIALMQHGRIVADGLPSEVLTAERISAVFGVKVEVGTDSHSARPEIRILDIAE